MRQAEIVVRGKVDDPPPGEINLNGADRSEHASLAELSAFPLLIESGAQGGGPVGRHEVRGWSVVGSQFDGRLVQLVILRKCLRSRF